MLGRKISSVLLIVFITIAVVASVASPEGERQLPPEATASPTFSPDYILLPVDTLLELAFTQASIFGLQQITSHEIAWFQLGDYWGEKGIGETVADVNLPLFIVSFQGSGEWGGFGMPLDGDNTPEKINGVTIALNATNGSIVNASSGYDALVLTSGRRAKQVFVLDEDFDPIDLQLPVPPPPDQPQPEPPSFRPPN